MSRVLLFVATILQVSYAEFPVPNKQNEANRSYWERLGDEIIQEKLSRQPVTNLAKNVVLFLGDGMGVSTVTAARIYKGQSKYNNSGEEYVLSWERFPYVALSKTYGLDTQTSDSANSATAYLCGVKANMGTLGVDSTVKAKQCHNDSSAYVDSIMQWAQDAGKWTGIVTTTAVTDATPAGSYAHSGYRRWQYDVPKGCNASDIAQQLILNSPGKNMRVILGAGRKVFFNSTEYDEECKKGLFDNEQMPYWLNRSEPNSTKPNLTEMVTVALKILSKAPKGFVLLVEGGRIDHAHHANRAKLALQETLEFDEAVHKTVRTLPENETLYVVTADHSHTMSIAGHPSRGTNILGLAGNTTLRREPKSTYTVLSYAVGPGYRERENYTEEETSSDDFLQQSTYPLWSATHGGEDVAVYAKGPWAHLFDGVNDQTYIPYVMAYASCIGQFNGSKCHQYNA
ncbi:alkaline phosphatase, tissue-nonspecific isozyme-like isoform X3 [Rhipicephalus microplus]|uniref:alkaline phosphatase, tissue-nonspecific isozyme-like isoform X3 n=1 Tax=Rhipicephalus microplus TaxID=6941 RepID=UPI003F6B2AFD